LLVENYFQTPSSALGFPLGCGEFLEGFPYGNNPTISKFSNFYIVFADYVSISWWMLETVHNNIFKESCITSKEKGKSVQDSDLLSILY